ncbi:hypothetical protein K501DRAFT_310393 [Backusella circina FSU 941]|nr:hypothetical protein K501DRAFT_310393 [Backusella circina FSU 941]
MKLATVALASVLLCVVNATSIHKRADEATVNACLAGIEDAHAPAIALPKKFKTLFESKNANHDKALDDVMKTAKLAIAKVEGYSKPCDQIDSSYTAEQNIRLLKSVTPLISSLAETYQQLIDNKDKVLNVYKIGDFISLYADPINKTLDKFIAWQEIHGSNDITEATKDEIAESRKLIENMNKLYSH